MLKSFVLIFIAIFLSFGVYCQDMTGFTKLQAAGNKGAQLAYLENWHNQKPGDAELYIAYFNYYALSSNIGTKTNVKFDRKILNKGFLYIDSGIKKYPSRLDMRLGKIFMLNQCHDYNQLTKDIVGTLNHSAAIKNKWTWSDGQPLADPKSFMLSTIQGYIVQLYNAGTESAKLIKLIADAETRYYPKYAEGFSNLAISYSIQNDLNNALATLLKAEKLDPNNFVVLNNIADIYYRKGDRSNAIKYYELTLKHGNDKAKKIATERLQLLKK